MRLPLWTNDFDSILYQHNCRYSVYEIKVANILVMQMSQLNDSSPHSQDNSVTPIQYMLIIFKSGSTILYWTHLLKLYSTVLFDFLWDGKNKLLEKIYNKKYMKSIKIFSTDGPKYFFFEKKIRFVPALDLIKCFTLIK